MPFMDDSRGAESVVALGGLVRVTGAGLPAELRCPPRPGPDAAHPSQDHRSGPSVPGTAVGTVRVPGWWLPPAANRVAPSTGQSLQELREGARPWILTEKEIECLADEPLTEVQPVPRLDADQTAQVHERCRGSLGAGRETHS